LLIGILVLVIGFPFGLAELFLGCVLGSGSSSSDRSGFDAD
jgi:hypothetical protein